MVVKNIKKIIVYTLMLSFSHVLYAWLPTNVYRPDATIMRLHLANNAKWSLGFFFERGSSSDAENINGRSRNVLAVHDDTQSVISMLENPIQSSKKTDIEDLFNRFIAQVGPTTNDGVRGNVKFFGDYEQTQITLFGDYKFNISFIPGTMALALYMPFVNKEVESIHFEDQTKGNFGTERFLQQEVINNLVSNVETLGDLKLDAWNESGVGDTVVMLEWMHDVLVHDKKTRKARKSAERGVQDYVKNFTVLAKLGISVPSGTDTQEDFAFSLPLGNDDAWGFPGGIAVNVDFIKYFRAGVYLDFLYLLNYSRVFRMKTHVEQTEFLLLNKGRAEKNPGFIWDFGVYFHVINILKGLSFKTSYHYAKKHEDKLFSRDPEFSNDIINTTNSLKGSESHSLTFHFGYDFQFEKKQWRFAPELSIFYKMPLSGESVADMHTFGGKLGVSF